MIETNGSDHLASGTVAECWRYPVKSFQGIRQDRLTVGPTGVDGDRTFGLIDVDVDRLLSAKRTADLLDAWATDTTITLPNGDQFAVDDPGVDAALTAWLGRPIRFARASESDPVSYQMTFNPPEDTAELFDIPSPVGSFLDLAHVHLITTATLDACARQRPDLDWDVRRFRPNVLIEIDGPAFVEQTWLGRRIEVGGATLSIDSPTVRCAMPLRAQPDDLHRQPGLFRAMGELNDVFPNHLGVYCSVVVPGEVAQGDPVTVT
ncbi:MAG: MOSC domain-containing protein [Aquihabitans sp.]